MAGTRCAAVIATAAVLAVTARAQEPRRPVPPHQHGQGVLNIAIDGPLLLLELDVPAADLLGFEHAPRSAEEAAALAQAEAALRDPRSLFVLPREAGCRVQDMAVRREADEGAGHADFHAEYALACTATAALTAVDFAFFERFGGAQALQVNLAGARGQGRFEVTRAAPHLDLGRRD